MLKSLALDAYWPSFPLIPIPTCAAVIIFTSFAPSPIAKVVLWGKYVRTNVTISYFYLGDTLHANTTFDD
jgi:hypothetical protein